MIKLTRFIFYYFLGVLGIIFVSNAPALMQGGNWLDFSAFFSSTWTLIKELIQPEKWTYFYLERELNIFSFLWNPFKYSMTLLGGGLLLGFTLAFVLAILTLFLPQAMINLVKRILGILESIPDLMIAFVMQIAVVYILKQTGVLVIDFVTLGSDKVYLAPIIVLSIIPMIFLYRIVILLIEEELTKNYVEFALSKGIKYNIILIKHVLLNIVKSVFYHSKIIVWTSLSSLFVIEYIFNINGISNHVIQDFRPLIVTFVLWMIFTPLFIIYQGIEIFIFKEDYTSRVVQKKQAKKGRIWGLQSIWDWLKQIGLEMVTKLKNPKPFSIKSWLKRIGAELLTHFKNPKFLIGVVVIMGILIVSIVHTIIQDPSVEEFVLVYDDEGNLISSKPHRPSEYVPMGSDFEGYSIKDQLLSGAKYTILFASSVALLRVVFGILFAIPYAMLFNNRFKKGIEKFVDSFHYLPLTVIAVILLTPILTGSTSGFSYSFTERLLMEAIILTILVVPQVSVLLGNEINLIMQNEFIAGAKVLGGDNLHILRKHVMPHLSSKLGIVFGQQFIQVILVLIHLGLFQLFLGGTSVMYDQFYRAPKHSVTFEWSGIISNARDALQTERYWIIIPVFVAFMIVILAMQLIVEGIQDVQQKRVGVSVRESRITSRLISRKQKNNQEDLTNYSLAKKDFTFVNHQHNRE